ncbi:MAG: hypothetical protein G01um101433_66 [Parcubacteria group bacterium Gr01-1014_33]|nr:MAG: hypothetical protein G01um101433_66 [Parcubacteria group bacterium Gr01-1014_33]
MTTVEIEKKIARLYPQGKKSMQSFVKEALFLQLQEVNKKIALFEGKYNKQFEEFKRNWAKQKGSKKYSYEIESDFFDWEVLEEQKRDIMNVLQSL